MPPLNKQSLLGLVFQMSSSTMRPGVSYRCEHVPIGAARCHHSLHKLALKLLDEI